MKTSSKTYTWTVDLWDNDKKTWYTDTRSYYCEKRDSDFDLRTIPGIRKNATLKAVI